MEAVGDVKAEPVALGHSTHHEMVTKSVSAEKVNGRPVKRKRVLAELERGQKRSCGSGELNSSAQTSSKGKPVKDAGAGFELPGKRKRTKLPEAESDLDSEHVINAAQALYELLGGGPTRRSVEEESRIEAVKWAGKRSRSSRSKRAEDCACKLGSSSTTSATVSEIPEVLDSSDSHNLIEACQQVAERVNREEESETEGRSVCMIPGLGLGLDGEHKLVSQSSLESTFPNSRAESPSSPLPVLRRDDVLVPKLEEELLVQFGFQRSIPIRPSKTPLTLRKPKAEERSTVESDDFKIVKVAAKQVQRRKPRASKSELQALLPKAESGDLQTASSSLTVLKECIEENKCLAKPMELATLNLFEPVKVESGILKFETKPLQKMGSSTQGRLKSALSEAEKEARRLRRVQANRESARQTIRRKQVLCEELARKASDLQAEKEDLTQKMELASRDLQDQLELNQRLKEQMVLQVGIRELPLLPTRVGDMVSPSPSAIPYGGVSLPPYWWAFALAQAMAANQSSAPQVGEGVQVPDFNPMFAATVAAFNSGIGMNPNMWMSMMGSMPNMNPFLGKAPAPEQQPTLSNMSAKITSALDSSVVSPQNTAGMMAGVADRSQSLGKSYMNPNHGSNRAPVSSMDCATKSDTCNVGPRIQSSGKAELAGMTNAMPSSLHQPIALSGKMKLNPSTEGMSSASTSLSLGRTSYQSHAAQVEQMRKPTNVGFFKSFGNGVQGYLAPRQGQSGSAALATEARRRRRELKRTKSLQSRLQQGQRLAGTRTL